MKNLIFFLLFTTLCFAQSVNVVTEGYYQVLVNGVFISNHTKESTAFSKAINVQLADPSAKVEIIPPAKLRVDIEGFEFAKTPIVRYTVNSITIQEVTDTKATILMDFGNELITEAYIEFFEEGGFIQQTNRSVDKVQSLDLLKSGTTYYFRVYALVGEARVITSDLFNFKTL